MKTERSLGVESWALTLFQGDKYLSIVALTEVFTFSKENLKKAKEKKYYMISFLEDRPMNIQQIFVCLL